MSEPALRIEALKRAYGGAHEKLVVLDGAELTIQKGEMVALVAPSGTGKSTLLHAAGLLERADGGDVWINGLATGAMEDRQRTLQRRSSIGFVYQFHHLLPEFTAQENLMLPQMVSGISNQHAVERSKELLGYLGLEGRASHRPSELSGGEQQRVAIARAVVNSPSLLLADEPTGNLDPETSDRVFTTLETLVRETGLGALIATHNHELARRMDRAITLKSARVEPLFL